MMALSLYQPWASFVAWGLKSVETRSWQFAHRGALAVHAGKRPLDRIARDVAARTLIHPGVREYLTGLGVDPDAPFPFGAVVGAVQVVNIYRAEAVGLNPAATFRGWERDDGDHRHDPDGKPVYVTPLEYSLGDYSPGRFAILLDRPTRLPTPAAARGFQQLFTVPDDLIPAAVREVVTRPGRSWR